MKKALSLSVVALMAVVACAQDDGAFPDTPANHWAYEALKTMKADGLLVGYPDGMFRGPRPASRYELAVAMHAVYTNLKNRIDGIQSELDTSKSINPQDISNLVAAVDQLKSDVAAMKDWGDDIAALKRAASTFELELEQLGVDVEAMRHTLGDLETRVGVLEKKKPTVDITGQTDFWMGAGNSRSGYIGLSMDGRAEGTSDLAPISSVFPPVPGAVGLAQDANFIHEAAFTFSSTNDTGPKWGGTVVVTDAFGFPSKNLIGFGNQSELFSPGYGSFGANSTIPVGILGYQAGQEDIYVQDAGITVGGPKANIEFGRIGYSVSPYMLQRIDNNSYYANERWDNGEYYYDGVLGKLVAGPATLHVFGGNNSGVTSVSGVQINPLQTGIVLATNGQTGNFSTGTRIQVNQTLGADLNLEAKKLGNIDLAFISLSGTSETLAPGVDAGHLNVYGADAKLHLGPFNVDGGYHKTDLGGDGLSGVASDNYAANVGLSARHGSYNLYAEYREIGANYLAPGDWGRLGVLQDLTNLKGYRFGGSVDIWRKFKFTANGEFDSGLSDNYGDITFLGSNSKIEMYQVRLDYRAKKNLTLFGGWESTRFGHVYNVTGAFLGSGDPLYQWTTFGLDCGISSNTKFTLQYQLSDVDNDYQVTNGSNFRGGFLTSQLTYKF